MAGIMAARVCERCKALAGSEDLFCKHCGRSLAAPSVEPSVAAAGYFPTTPQSAQVVPVVLPGWLTLGIVLVLIGALLIFAGSMVYVVGTAALNASSTLDSIKAFDEQSAALAGVGIFLALLGWALHQMSLHRRDR